MSDCFQELIKLNEEYNKVMYPQPRIKYDSLDEYIRSFKGTSQIEIKVY